ncbi:MAG: sugar ABC transporter substrate-binding protein [Candidatus Humimicrobiaceae bacterium]
MSKKLKLTFVVILCVAIVLTMGFVGCKTTTTTTTTTTAAAETTAAPTTAAAETTAANSDIIKIGQYEFKKSTKDPKDLEIAVFYMNITHPFAQLIKAGVDAAAKEFGVNAYMTGPLDWTTESQIAVLETLIAKKVDGLSLAVLDIPGITPVIQKALSAGIPTTCNNVDAPDSGRLGFIGEDLYKSGVATAEALVEVMGEKGNVILSTVGVAAFWSQERERGVRDTLAKYPDIKIVGMIDAAGDEQTAYAALENGLTANPDLNGHISCGGTLQLWARLLKNRNVGNKDSAKPIYSTGHDIYEETLTGIIEGWTTTSFGQNPYDQGYEAVKQLYQFLTTSDPSVFKVIDTGLLRIDSTNAEEYLKKMKAGEPIG